MVYKTSVALIGVNCRNPTTTPTIDKHNLTNKWLISRSTYRPSVSNSTFNEVFSEWFARNPGRGLQKKTKKDKRRRRRRRRRNGVGVGRARALPLNPQSKRRELAAPKNWFCETEGREFPADRLPGPPVHRTAALLTSPKSKLSIKFVITDGKSVGKRFLMTRWDGQVHMWNKWEISTESRFLKNGSQESNVVSEAVAKPWPTFDALSPTWTASLFFVHLSPRVNRYACL